MTFLDDPDVVENLGGFRREILAALEKPGSATTVAERLGSTRQKVNYHLRELEKSGLVELVGVRPRRGFEERVLRRVADVVLIDPSAFDTSGLIGRDAAGINGVVSLSTDLIRHAAAVSTDASARGERVAAAALDGEATVASPSRLRSMLNEIGEVIARYDTGGAGLRVRVSTTVLPQPLDQA